MPENMRHNTIQCEHCGNENPISSTYCQKCAAVLTISCPSCGHQTPNGSRYCNQCGFQLPVPAFKTVPSTSSASLNTSKKRDDVKPPALIGEKREVTILALSFVINNKAGDKESSFILLGKLLERIIPIVQEYDCYIENQVGYGISAIFGLPVLTGNDPVRAVEAALAVGNVLQSWQRRSDKEFGLVWEYRIGIHTGDVIVNVNKANLNAGFTLVGAVPETAVSLQQASTPNTITVSKKTYQRTRRYFHYLASHHDKFHPLRVKQNTVDTKSILAHSIPFIGRKALLQNLTNTLFTAVTAQNVQVALIHGEAGIGKSRLLETLKTNLSKHKSAPTICQGACLPHTQKRPYWLIAEMLRSLISLAQHEPQTSQITKIRSYLHELHINENDTLPHLIRILGLKPKDTQPIQDSLVLNKMAYAAIHQILTAESKRIPILIILEDLHWVDATSCNLIAYLLKSLHNLPITFIFTTRHEPKGCYQKVLEAAQNGIISFQEYTVQPLSPAETRDFVNALLPINNDEFKRIKEQIITRGGGNPLYLEELIYTLINGGGLVQERGQWHITDKAAALTHTLPDTLRGLLLARFDKLPPSLKEIVQHASIWGKWFKVEYLAELLEQPPDMVLRKLVQLIDLRYLVREEREDGVWFGFGHGLAQDAIYSTLLSGQKKVLHGRVAAYLLKNPQTGWLEHDLYDTLVFHLLRSERPYDAVPYLLQAGQRAVQEFANETAVYHYRHAVTLIKNNPSADKASYFQATMGLSTAYKQLGQIDKAATLLNNTLQKLLPWSLETDSEDLLPILINGLSELADIEQRQGNLAAAVSHLKAGLTAIGTAVTPQQQQYKRKLLGQLALVYFRQGYFDEAINAANQALTNFNVQNEPDPITTAKIFNTLGGIAWQQGNLPEAVKHVEQALKLNQLINYKWGIAGNYNNLAILHAQQGETRKAIQFWEEALAIRREQGDLHELALLLSNLGKMHLIAGNQEMAKTTLEEARAVSLHLGEKTILCNTKINLAWYALRELDVNTAVTEAQNALTLAQEAQSIPNIIRAKIVYAYVLAEKGELTQALQLAKTALAQSKSTGFLEGEIDASRITGIIYFYQGDNTNAELNLKESIELAIQVKDKLKEGLARMELGHLYAQRTYVGSFEWFTTTLDTFTEAEKVLNSIGAQYDAAKCKTQILSLQAYYKKAKQETKKSPQPPTNAEKRIATILWLNLTPPTQVQDDPWFESLAQLLPNIEAIIEEHAGNPYVQGNRITALFGIPVTYEDDAANAVAASLKIQQLINNPPASLEIVPNIHIAIIQDQVMAGQLQLNQGTKPIVTGEAYEEAGEIARQVPPNQVWVANNVRAKAAHLFNFQPIQQELPNNQSLWLLTGVRETPQLARGIKERPSRFVGRDTHLQQMLEITNNLSQKFGGIIWIEGEAGIGKSRLMREYQSHLLEQDVMILKGTCFPQKANRAFSLFSDLLANMLQIEITDTPETIRQRLTAVMEQWPKDAQFTKPYLETILSLPPSGIEGERLQKLEPEQLRQQTFVALRRFLKTIAKQRPLILIFDDLHWVDTISAELLIFLAPMVTSDPILFICAQRREGSDLPNERLLQLQSLLPGQTLHLFLQRLSKPHCHALIEDLLPGITLSHPVEKTIIEYSEGNPYFIEEYVRMFIEQGHLKNINNQWFVSDELAQNKVELPVTLDILLRSRVDALPDHLKQILQAASILGSHFDIHLLTHLVELPNPHHSLKRLESRLMLQYLPHIDQWEFSHKLLHEVVYHSLLRVHQQTLHAKAAYAIQHLSNELTPESIKEIAHHLVKADKPAEALPYLIQAGEFSASQFASDEAISYFQMAETCLKQLPSPHPEMAWRVYIGLSDVYLLVGKFSHALTLLEKCDELLRTHTEFALRKAEVDRRLGHVYWKLGGFEKAQTHFSSAQTLLTKRSDTKGLLELARTLIGKAWVLFSQGKLKEAEGIILESLPYAEQAGNLNVLASAENLLGGIYFQQNQWREALHHTTRAMVLREQLGYTWGTASSLSNLGILAFVAGHWHKAIDFFSRSLEKREDMGDIEGMAITHNNLGLAYRGQGEFNLSEKHFRESIKLTRAFKLHYHLANSLVGLAMILVWQKRFEEAFTVLQEGQKIAQSIGAKDIAAESLLVQAELTLANGRLPESYDLAQQATLAASELRNHSLEIAGQRVAAHAALLMGNTKEAQTLIEQAISKQEKAVDELENGKLAAQAYKVYKAVGLHDLAQEQLDNAKTIFNRLGAQHHLQQLEAEVITNS